MEDSAVGRREFDCGVPDCGLGPPNAEFVFYLSGLHDDLLSVCGGAAADNYKFPVRVVRRGPALLVHRAHPGRNAVLLSRSSGFALERFRRRSVMSIKWKVRIDIPRRQANLSRANEWPFTPDSTFRWPAFMGFRQLGGVWHTDGPRLNRFQPDEILEELEVRRPDSAKSRPRAARLAVRFRQGDSRLARRAAAGFGAGAVLRSPSPLRCIRPCDWLTSRTPRWKGTPGGTRSTANERLHPALPLSRS